jgi:pilus assembly protein CpaB
MNPRQRRGLLLVLVSIVGAVGVFASVVNYVAEVETQVGPVTTVLRLAQDARPYQPVTEQMVEQVEVPVRWKPPNALASALELEGQVPTVTLPAGTVLQTGLLVEPPHLQDGEREIAILVDAETGVAGKIGRGSIVDIYATFPPSDSEPAHASIVVENAEIIDVGTPTPTANADESTGFSQGEVVPVTFALSVDESLRLAYIESFAQNVRLALRAPDDTTNPTPQERLFQPGGAVVESDDDGRGRQRGAER